MDEKRRSLYLEKFDHEIDVMTKAYFRALSYRSKLLQDEQNLTFEEQDALRRGSDRFGNRIVRMYRRITGKGGI